MNPYSDPTPIATVEQFKAALLKVRDQVGVSQEERMILQAQYQAPNHTISPAQLAKQFNFKSHRVANIKYGTLAHNIADALNYKPGPFPDKKDHWWFTLSFWNDDSAQTEKGEDQWVMRPEFVRVLEEWKWVKPI